MKKEEAVAKAMEQTMKRSNTMLDEAIRVIDFDETDIESTEVGTDSVTFTAINGGKRFHVCVCKSKVQS